MNMASYYVNRNAQQVSGDHEVHKDGCTWMPEPGNRIYLGEFPDCKPAVVKATEHYKDSNGCAHCCPACHTT